MVSSLLPNHHSESVITTRWLPHLPIGFGTFQFALAYVTSSVLPNEPSQVGRTGLSSLFLL